MRLSTTERRNEGPDWTAVMKQDRLNTDGYANPSDTFDVFASDENPESAESDMETERGNPSNGRARDESPRPQLDIPPHAMLNMAGPSTHPGDSSVTNRDGRPNSPTRKQDDSNTDSDQ